MAVTSWAEYDALVALMQPGDVDVDPLERFERCGEPVDLVLAGDVIPTDELEPAPAVTRATPVSERHDGGCRGCGRLRIRARGLCGGCYERWRRSRRAA